MNQPAGTQDNITVAMTGASGAVYTACLLRLLVADERIARIDFVSSDHALRVTAEELGISGRNGLVERLAGEHRGKIHHHTNADIGAGIASGSYPTRGMIVLPCSMGTLASIAHGMANRLIERAADVCLKERRPLLLCVRETPFHLIHLRNMTQATEAGATIFPAMPALYHNPQTTEQMATQFCCRVLAHVGLVQPEGFRWTIDPLPQR